MSAHLAHPSADVADEMPHNMECEQAILGAVMSNNEAMLHLPELRPEHFYASIHQKIYATVLEMSGGGMVANPVTMKNVSHLKDAGMEDRYLAKLVSAAISIVNLHDYGRILIELTVKRQLLAAAAEMVAQVRDISSGDMATILAKALNDVNQSTIGRRLKDSRSVSIAVAEGMSKPQQRQTTGLIRFDRAIGGGLMKGQLYGVAGRRGEGKTMFGGTISQNLNDLGVRHLYIPIEMGQEEIQKRALARRMEVNVEEFSLDDHAEGFYGRLGDAATRDRGCVFYFDDAFLTFEGLKRLIATSVTRNRIDGFMLDYWQLVAGKAPKETKAAHLEQVAQWCAAACKEYDIWGILLAQLNRDGNIRDSDGLEMAASNIFYIHRPDKTQPEAWLETQKARHSKFMHVGSKENPSFEISRFGSHFEERVEQSVLFSATNERKGKENGG